MPGRSATSSPIVIAVILFIAILASLGVALVALFKRGDHSQTLLRALTVRVSLSVLFFLLLMLGWYLGFLQPHGLGG
jgi:formate-dependent nitrite reductase membrane component NrfD